MNTDNARIVVGIGDDAAADAALAYGITEARRRDIELVAVRAWGPLADPSPRDIAAPGAEAELRNRAARAIERAFATVGGVPGDVNVTRRIVEGAPGPAMVSAADRPGDLIVLGRPRHRLARRAVFGSVADFVLDHATCPVLVQPGPRTPRPDHRRAAEPPAGVFS